MTFVGFPFIVGWEFTQQCNLRCQHCGSSAGEPRPEELSTKEALDICDQFTDLLVQEVDFTGGEPLLRNDFDKVVSKLTRSGILVNVLTNGLIMSSDTVSRLKDLGISCVGISLDGMESTHDRIRARTGSFNAVLTAMDNMQQQDMPFNVISTISSCNLNELPALHSLLSQYGTTHWRLQAIFPEGRAKQHSELTLDKTGLARLGRFIQTNHAISTTNAPEILCSDGLQYVVQNPENESPWRGCPAGITACGITSDGRIKGCLSMPDELIEGDLRKDTLWRIWFRDDAFPYSRAACAEHVGDNCNNCPKIAECKGGCSVSSYALTGKFNNDPYCVYNALQ